jgi:CRISPR-associated endonuclease/helicase Cas3
MSEVARFSSFDELVMTATGGALPYAYQRTIAEAGLPEVLAAPTGAGKTLGAVLPWLWRRRFHADMSVREATPHWLVFALPMRVLVEQTYDAVAAWLDRLGMSAAVGLHLVLGGEGRLESAWRREPERDAVFIGTVDMLLSRALNRGYAESRFSWPIDFGLFNNGCHWVFDEIQLMGPALATSRQLEGLRREIGVALPTGSTWMSATIDAEAMRTVDHREVGTLLTVSDADRSGPLARRLDAPKTVEHRDIGARTYVRDVAGLLADSHREGTLTLAVLNTVRRAQELAVALRRSTDVEVMLLHSRFRPHERRDHLAAALSPLEHDGGRIIVATQVVEAGVDLSTTTLFTEAAPWPSIVQRAGRCNRTGDEAGARLLWSTAPRPDPYDGEAIEHAIVQLKALEGSTVTPATLQALDVRVHRPVHPVLRRRDLVALFDTAPDLSGNDVDIARFIREADDRDVQVAWRAIDGQPPAEMPGPVRDELCPAPIGEIKEMLTKGTGVWRFDHLEKRWTKAIADEILPGAVLVLDVASGGYTADVGWNPKSVAAVPTVGYGEPDPLGDLAEATGDDRPTFIGLWVGLRTHLADVEFAVRELGGLLRPRLADEVQEAVAIAGRLHDVGKAHPVFQDTMVRSASEDERPDREAGIPWAKSAGRARHERRYFRHELASALALLGEGAAVLESVAERALVVYLVAAHHGRVRLGIRSLPDEVSHPVPGGRVALGILDGEELPEVEIPGGVLPASILDLSVMELGGSSTAGPSWTARALALRDRPDLGIFRLGFCEAWLRLADWRASAQEAGT